MWGGGGGHSGVVIIIGGGAVILFMTLQLISVAIAIPVEPGDYKSTK